MSDYKVFNDNGEERTWEELYQDNVMLQLENQAYKEAIKRCYTPEEIDFEIMSVKAELEAEKDINNNLHKKIDKLRVNLYETQQDKDNLQNQIDKALNFIDCHFKEMVANEEAKQLKYILKESGE